MDTAGIRILNAIEHFNLTNIAAIVIRYFGGTKLGMGLLGKTYYESAFQNLSEAKKTTKSAYQKVIIKVDFEFVSFVHRILSSFDAKIDSINYEEQVKFICFVKTSDVDNLKQKIIDLTHGAAIINYDEEHKYL